jgi:hypothetical protein
VVPIEQELCRWVDDAGRAVLVGAVTGACASHLFFYARMGASSPSGLRFDLGEWGGRRVTLWSERDREWHLYRRTLWPTRWEMRWLDDRVLVERLRDAGDETATARPVDHHVSFVTPWARREFAQEAARHGFTVHAANDVGSCGARLVREDAVVLGHIHGVVRFVAELAERFGGRYEGWSSPLVRTAVA